ncbi:MAG: hypothetical protein ACO1TE_26525 [Prosthecobacter sp.]
MKPRATLPLLLLCLAFTGCETTSISNTGRNPLYRGEISEADLLGISSRKNISDGDIRAALSRSSGGHARLRHGEPVLLIQSGALQPDPELSRAFARHVRAQPYSGVPQSNRADGDRIPVNGATPIDPKTLRLAAAHAGATKIVCVWGLVESADNTAGLEYTAIIPILGDFLPSKRTVRRLTLKGIVMNTASGTWESFSTDPIIDTHTTSAYTREFGNARKTLQLKGSAYEQLAAKMMR